MYELSMDPFERSHRGKHGAFVLRVNQVHVERVSEAIRMRREGEETVFVADQGMVAMQRAA
jgi:hypothetical protein